ncbi:MAG: class I SAM-dependent methyltransferase [Gammaproteobacteria bacterium]|nr:class I SAM-dependent methyltransferase [Gammaproteobacteria bacterium]
MINNLNHELKVESTKNERSRQEFVAALRSHVLGDMASHMRDRYHSRYGAETKATSGTDVHEAMQSDPYFRYYSAVRYNAQEMVFRSVVPTIDRNHDKLNATAATISSKTNSQANIDPDLAIPRSVSEIDVHLAPGSYHTEYAENDVAAGAIYDNSINVFAFNQMGRNMDDIGHTISNYLRLSYPDFSPERILDCGCTVGHNTLPWKQTFPDAEVTGVDVSAPIVRYGASRAGSMGIDVNFMQMNATSLDFPDNHFDVVFSSMFLHELPLKDIHAYMAEAFRVLRPGGVLLTMELPPNESLGPYEQFYLDWDCYYNNEPFYKAFRDQNYRELCSRAGFDTDAFFEFEAPRYTYMSEAEFIKELNAEKRLDDSTGTLTDDLRWFGFGCWKQS